MSGLSGGRGPALRRAPSDPTLVTMVDDKSTGYALGAVDYLTKPVDRERLAGVLAKLQSDPGSGPAGRRRRRHTRTVAPGIGEGGVRGGGGRERSRRPGTDGRNSTPANPVGSDNAGNGRIRICGETAPEPSVDDDSGRSGYRYESAGRGARAPAWTCAAGAAKGRQRPLRGAEPDRRSGARLRQQESPLTRLKQHNPVPPR